MKATQIKKSTVIKDGRLPVRLKAGIVELVRANKAKTGIPISTFFELAAEKQLKIQKK